ncbi:MAG: hypothetical protein RL220_2106 [Bacteroidota bacterium]|jgi:putative endonuclease
MTENKNLGDLGEEMARDYLLDKGYGLCEMNWKSDRFEIDLIMKHGPWLVFVEVKTRRTETFGDPWEAVNRKKRKKIITAADHYIRLNQSEEKIRFDIVSIVWPFGSRPKITHIEQAFYPEP